MASQPTIVGHSQQHQQHQQHPQHRYELQQQQEHQQYLTHKTAKGVPTLAPTADAAAATVSLSATGVAKGLTEIYKNDVTGTFAIDANNPPSFHSYLRDCREGLFVASSPYSNDSSASSVSPRSAYASFMANNGDGGEGGGDNNSGAGASGGSGSSELFTCLWPGCEGAFKRATDLDRHYVTVHRPGDLIPCKYGWCGRTGDRGFSRRDHYRDHLREVHREDIPRNSKKGQGPS